MISRPVLPRRLPSLPRLLSQVRHYRIENKGLKLLALLIAFFLFVISRQPVREVLLVSVPIEFRGMSAGLEISSEVAHTVSVRLRGPRDVVRNIMPNQIAVIADLSHREPGERIVQLKPDDVSRPSEIEVLRIEPASIKLRLEPTVRRQIPVAPQFLGRVAEGYEVYSTTADPPVVEIEGPESHINQVGRAMTESIQLDGRSASFKVPVDVDIPDHTIRMITPGPITLFVEVGGSRTERRFTDLPIEWLDQPTGAHLPAQTVDVVLYGPRQVIEALRTRDIRVEASAARSAEGVTAAKPYVRLLSNQEAHIEVKSITPNEVKLKK